MIDDEGRAVPSGNQLLSVFRALANPHRLRILAELCKGRQYVSELARQLGISRPLLHMHLKRLEGAQLVTGELSLSDDGKAMRYFQVTPFALHLTPERIAAAVATLTDGDPPAEEDSQ